jgi:hypothetical protein
MQTSLFPISVGFNERLMLLSSKPSCFLNMLEATDTQCSCLRAVQKSFGCAGRTQRHYFHGIWPRGFRLIVASTDQEPISIETVYFQYCPTKLLKMFTMT